MDIIALNLLAKDNKKQFMGANYPRLRMIQFSVMMGKRTI